MHDITVEVSKNSRSETFLKKIYSDIEHFNARNEKKCFNGFSFTIICAEAAKLFGQA